MTNLSEFTFLSSDGKTQLHGMLWEPEGVAVRRLALSGDREHIRALTARHAFDLLINQLTEGE